MALGLVLGGCWPLGDDKSSQEYEPGGPPVTFAVGAVALTVVPTASFAADGGTLTVTTDPDGSVRLEVASSSTTLETVATITVADGTRLEVLTDGSGLVRDDAAILAGISPKRARMVDDGQVVLSAGDGGVLWMTDTAVLSLDWGNREGGSSLAVKPSAWGRSGTRAAAEMVWAVVAAEPGADSKTMRDQLECHQFGAPEKATWNLEPWRPEVDPVALALAYCNPS